MLTETPSSGRHLDHLESDRNLAGLAIRRRTLPINDTSMKQLLDCSSDALGTLGVPIISVLRISTASFATLYYFH